MSDEQPAVLVKGLFKSFKLPHEQHNGIKQLLVNFAKRKKGFEVQHVLNDVSFEIKKGEFFGIVGRNGSGKSTLLKLLAGIYTPDEGVVQVNGTLTPFIELGVGFNPELTGRENVFLNGALLGFSRDEMDGMYGDIVEFAELDRFMDQKLKNYSSGMQVRLAFSIAIRAQSDILLLDEVLAVGDEAFQQKCFDYFEKLKANKKTVILVTHDMAIVKRYCSKALVLINGEIDTIGDPEKVSAIYTGLNRVSIEQEMAKLVSLSEIDGLSVKLRAEDGEERTTFSAGDRLIVDMEWDDPSIKNIGIAIFKQTGERVFATNTFKTKTSLSGNTCQYKVKLDLSDGKYYLRMRFFGETENDTIYLIDSGPELLIKRDKRTPDGLVLLEHTWLTKKGS